MPANKYQARRLTTTHRMLNEGVVEDGVHTKPGMTTNLVVKRGPICDKNNRKQ